jgi:hypothetical protein
MKKRALSKNSQQAARDISKALGEDIGNARVKKIRQKKKKRE